MTNAQRQQAYRTRMEARGRFRVELWLADAETDAVYAFLADLRKTDAG